MKPKEQPGHAGVVSVRLVVVGAICLGLPLVLLGATGPAWWYNAALTTSGTTPVVSGIANDYAAVNQGQVKNIAVTAINELNAALPGLGGAGTSLNSMALSLTATSGSTNDFAAVNLGQLKAVAKPFYDRLFSIDYSGPPLTSSTYPWISSGLTANDYAVANIGQVKNLFGFDLTYSSDGNPLPNWWRIYYFGTLAVDPNASDPANDGVTNIEAYEEGRNPLAVPAQDTNGSVGLVLYTPLQ